MTGGLTTSHIIIIKRRKIVMHKGCAVEELHRSSRMQQSLLRRP
jgi:hypothetical protein